MPEHIFFYILFSLYILISAISIAANESSANHDLAKYVDVHCKLETGKLNPPVE